MNPFCFIWSGANRLRPSKITGDRISERILPKIGTPEFVPLGDDGERIGAFDGIVATGSIRDPRAEDAFGHARGLGIERLHRDTGRQRAPRSTGSRAPRACRRSAA